MPRHALIRLRRDVAADWTSVDPVLALGEVGLETDTRKFKVGDGSTAWSGLSYWTTGGGGGAWGTISGTLSDQTDLQTALDAKQPLDADLTAIAALATTAFGRAFLALADEAAFKAAVNLEVGTDVQAYDADLTTYAGISPSANVQSLLGAADYSAMRTLLGLVIGTHVQAFDAELAALAGLTSAADKGLQFTGAGTAATYDLTAAGKALLDDADAAAQRTTLGLGAVAVLSAITEAYLTLADNTTDDVSTTKHGFAPKAPNDATKYLDGTGVYSVPAGGGGASLVTTFAIASLRA